MFVCTFMGTHCVHIFILKCEAVIDTSTWALPLQVIFSEMIQPNHRKTYAISNYSGLYIM